MQRANVVDRAQFAKPWMNGNAKRGAADGCGEMVARPLLAAVPEGRDFDRQSASLRDRR